MKAEQGKTQSSVEHGRTNSYSPLASWLSVLRSCDLWLFTYRVHMRADERRIYFFDLVAKRLGKSVQVPKLSEIVDVWQEHLNRTEAFHTRAKGDVLYQINDAEIDRDNEIATLLVSVIDKAMPDAAYGDLDTRKTLVMKKGPRQGGNLSAHMVVSLRPQKADTYLCLLENVRRLNAANIQFLLNHLLRKEYKTNESRFTYPHPGGARTPAGGIKRLPYLPLIGLGGHPSQALIEEIESGTIRHLNLIKSREQAVFSEDPYLVEEAYRLTVGVKPDIPQNKRWERLKSALQRHKEEFGSARITFVDSERNLRSVEFDLETETIDSTQFIKSQMIRKIEPLLADASEKIVPHLASRLREMLIEARGKGGE